MDQFPYGDGKEDGSIPHEQQHNAKATKTGVEEENVTIRSVTKYPLF
ncbi:MAG: hypothetical protein JWP89_2526 [Schlesneria sp.]|nr:hypothetical protein [Schlesneria sp.]